MQLQVAQVVTATRAVTCVAGAGAFVCDVSTDTRTLQAGDWFVAICGPHFDGHAFVATACARGAAGIVVSRDVDLTAARARGVWVLRVADTVEALGAMASIWRAQCTDTMCVGITGSNGKSTTKEMVASLATVRGAVLKTEGNFNNRIGMPLTLFRLQPSDKTAVIEMGMNEAGEIAALTRIADPDVGLITNVTAAHLETLRTVENVARAKGELFAAMRPDATIVVNMEDRRVRTLADTFPGRRITFGMGNDCDVQFGRMAAGDLTGMALTLYIRGAEYRTTLPVPGTHNVMNALAAIGVGLALGIAPDAMMARLGAFRPMRMRMERVQLDNGIQVINDCYNANPESMEAALRTVSAAPKAGRLLAVLGDMFELGEAAAVSHRALGTLAVRMGVQRLYLLGAHAGVVAAGAQEAGLAPAAITTSTDDYEAVAGAVLAEARPGDVILVKGSRGMQMERIVDLLKQTIGVCCEA